MSFRADSPLPVIATSFRDPAGSVFQFDNRIFRIVSSRGSADLKAFLESSTAVEWTATGRIVGTDILEAEPSAHLLTQTGLNEMFEGVSGEFVAEHERVPFPSYPYEWPPEMLHAAGRLTLDLARSLLQDGLGLKDGTPYNVLFRGPSPVFVDVLSFERRDPRDPTWLPYAQFLRTFVLPLLANKYFGIGIQECLISRRDGLEPEHVYRWSSPLQRLRPPFLSLVSIPTWLAARHDPDDHAIYKKVNASQPEKAQFILTSLLSRLSRALDRVSPRITKHSAWSDYMTSNNYSTEHFEAKERFVREFVTEYAPRTILDVGCNTGHFSALAARLGASVVAIDRDPVVVGQVWQNARAAKLNILPLVIDITRPTPGIGWLNQEAPAFLARANGSFDAVMMLAIIHHMLVTERVPLDDILRAAANLTNKWLIVEFIEPQDTMFRRLTRGRDELHSNLNYSVFEQACLKYFTIVRTQHLTGTARWLCLLSKR